MATRPRDADAVAGAAMAPSAHEHDADSWLGRAEMATLEAVCAALIPALAPPGGDDRHGFFARAASDLQVAPMVAAILAAESEEARGEMTRLLRLLGSPAGGLLLAGTPRPFAALGPAAQEAALCRMSASRLPQLRQGFQALKRLAMFVFYAAPGKHGDNPSWPAIGYTPSRPRESRPRSIRTLPVERDVTIDAEVAVVGSGAGGAVIAAHLAAAGHDVVVLEKGGYHNETDFTGSEFEMTPRLFLRRGLLTTRDLGMIVLAGSTLGGGTVVNWSTSLRAEDVVLAEWERDYGLEGLTGSAYQQAFARIEQRLGITTADSAPNANNAVLQRGCAALGYAWRPVPRNASGCAQRCGACGYGCPYGCKRSTLRTYLQDASDAGARTIVDCDVRRALVRHGHVEGVEGVVHDTARGAWHRVVVRAPRVVVAAGAVESPALLLRSGLDNPNVGRHLYLHPVAALASRYATPVECWSGSLQTVMSDHFAHLKDGYGVRIEAAPAHPGMLALATPWEGGRAHKEIMLGAAHHAVTIVLVRDTGEGRVTLDRHGEPVLHYWPNARDRYRLMRGMHEAARIACAAGARRVVTLHTPPIVLQSGDGGPGAPAEARLQAMGEEILRRGVVPNRLTLFSAHQMGTCRMGADRRQAVADPYGQVYGVQGLYVGDAGAFPTASGVNPMLSIMALADRVAGRIAAEM